MRSVCAAISVMVWASRALAEGDISLQLVGNQMITTKVTEDGVPLGPERVFGGAFSWIGGSWYTDEPGIRIDRGTLQAGSVLQLYFTRTLRQWNGSSFALVSAGRVSATFGPSSNSIVTPATDTNSANLLLPVDGSGGLHDHPDWVLENFDPGIDTYFFLVEARFSSTQSGLLDSDPFYIVFGVNADEQALEQMEDYVRENIVPAPGVWLCAGVFAGGIVRRRR
ncbi:MAG: hypothetical protein KF691_11910 [Phycisphaeraceae bacterium]|nr:hypothetical protein [Phycisphaeraceae bacterium]